jgi:hypothetical protein
MKGPRKWLISGSIVVFVLAHFSYLVTGDQHWPALGYPMYSYIHQHVTSCPGVFGVPSDPAKPEFRMRTRYLGMALPTAKMAFKKMLAHPSRSTAYARDAEACHGDVDACVSKQLVASALEYFYDRYQASHGEDEPPLRALKLYDVEFDFVDGTFVEKPRTLLGEWP